MASMRDIADAAGVSIRTVSRTLSGNGYVGASTRARVLEQARALDYRMNRAAQALRTGRSRTIGVLMDSLDELQVNTLAGFEQAMREAGYSVDVLFGQRAATTTESTESAEMAEGADQESAAEGANSLGDEPPAPPDLVAELMARRPAGALVFPGRRLAAAQLLPLVHGEGLPVVLVEGGANDRLGEGIDSVRIDRSQGVYESIHHLARQGRARIAYLGPADEPTRMKGYLRAMDELGRSPLVIDPHTRHQEQAAAVGSARILSMDPADRPDAVQAYTDVMAMKFLAALHEAGVRVPEELAVVGFDDRRAAALAWPPLTTVAQPNWAMGEAAAAILLGRIQGGNTGDGSKDRGGKDGRGNSGRGQGGGGKDDSAPGSNQRLLPTRLVIRKSG